MDCSFVRSFVRAIRATDMATRRQREKQKDNRCELQRRRSKKRQISKDEETWGTECECRALRYLFVDGTRRHGLTVSLLTFPNN